MPKTRNGVNLENIESLVTAIQDNRDLAKVRFVANSHWTGGTRSEVSVSELFAGGQNIAGSSRSFTLAVDEPPELGGTDTAPNPVEYLAASLCGCLTAGIATNAALFETDLEKIDITVEADLDIIGLLGLDRSVPTGCTDLNYTVRIKGPASHEKLVCSKETIDRKSPIRNTLKHTIRVNTDVIVEE